MLRVLEDNQPAGFYHAQNELRIEYCDPCKKPVEYLRKIGDPHIKTIPDPGHEIYNLNTDERGRWPRLKELGVI